MQSVRNTVVLILALAGLLCVTARVHAIDGSYHIPYTNNYGYTYDPETGQYVKKLPASKQVPAAPKSTTSSTQSGPALQSAGPATSKPVDTAAQSDLPYIKMLLSGGALFLAVVSLWLRQRKRNATFTG